MKLLQLQLLAFGPFTGRSLDLSDGDHGLHIVYGANEAGKSSALRALRSLLYGIAERSADDFVHRHSDLRVGGTLRRADGAELSVVRRKGRKATLSGAAGEVLGDDTLEAYLGGVSEPSFALLFGLDHEALLRGGEAVLDTHGEVGKLLFGAALGAGELLRLATQIEAESRELFLPRGSKPRLNAQLERCAELRREVASLSVSGPAWEQLQDRLLSVQRDIVVAEAQLSEQQQAWQARRELQQLQQRLEALQTQAQRTRQRLAQVDAELATLAAEGAVPEPETLMQLRQERDLAWKALRSQLKGASTTPSATSGELSAAADAYEASVVAADQLADELWTQASRVQRHLELRQRRTLLQGEADEHEAQLAPLRQQHEALKATLPAATNATLGRGDDPQARIAELYARKGQLEAELQRLDGSSRAATAAEQLQLVLSDVQEGVARYRALQLANVALQTAMEAYRRQHQEALLGRAAQLFARLTCGSFAGLAIIDDGSVTATATVAAKPLVVGRRASGKEVGVDGMSSGSRDQLYLALRLATLEQHLERHEALPLVIDDLLVHFDDERAAACLGVLAELASRTQVILFTHHRRIVELCEGVAAPAGVFVHAL